MEFTIENSVESTVIQRDSVLMGKIGGAIILSAILFYLNLYILAAKGSLVFSWKTAFYSISALICSIILFRLVTILDIIPKIPALPVHLILGVFTFYYAISLAYGLGLSWYKSEVARKNLLLEKNQAELTLLRNQLQPHFLFNALNNLLSLINQKQYSNAADAIGKLALLLRYVVEETKAEKVSLAQEILFVENYTSLQILRFDPGEIDLNIEITGIPEKWMVEPGLFLPFVENAFKYGAEPEVRSKIDIEFDLLSDSEINFVITNPRLIKETPQGSGTGIEAISKRLNIVYPDKHKLTISKDEAFTVHLKIWNA
jgi:sensor histidine kinase YesM